MLCSLVVVVEVVLAVMIVVAVVVAVVIIVMVVSLTYDHGWYCKSRHQANAQRCPHQGTQLPQDLLLPRPWFLAPKGAPRRTVRVAEKVRIIIINGK